MRQSRIRTAAAAAAVLLVSALTLYSSPARAQVQALDFLGGVSAAPTGNNTLGWQFNLSTTVTLTDLGVFDEGNDGFAETHLVGLWTTGGALLSSAALIGGPSGTPVVSASGFGAFRYESVPHLVLAPGDYVVAAHYPSANDPVRTQADSTAMATGFTFTQLRFNNAGSGFVFPGGTAASNGHFGANLRFIPASAAAAAPEPATLALLGMGLLAPVVGAVIRERRRRSSSKA